MEKKESLLYISELSLPNESAQTVQTFKMCSAFSKNIKTDIILFNSSENFKDLKKKYLLKNNFKIFSAFKTLKSLNFINRLIFFFIIKRKILKNNYKFIFTRSVLISILLSIFKYKNILEIHLPNTGLTKYLFLFYKIIFKNKYQKFILINKYLNKIFKFPKEKFLVLDTGVDLSDFKLSSKLKKYSCVYTGSFFKGKGFENIYRIAKKIPEIKFHAYGEKKFLDITYKKNKLKNLYIHNFVNYNKIPKILRQHMICLLPYQKKVHIKSNTVTAEKFMSPIKLMEYLAAKKIIIASKLQAYNHILKDKKNCFLISNQDIDQWILKIKFVIKNYKKLNYLKNNAYKTAKKYTIDKRVKKIISFYD